MPIVCFFLVDQLGQGEVERLSTMPESTACVCACARVISFRNTVSCPTHVTRLDRVAKTFRSKRNITQATIIEVDSQIDSTRAACISAWLESVTRFSRETCSQPAAKKLCIAPPPPSLVMRVSPHHLSAISRFVRGKVVVTSFTHFLLARGG